MKLRELLSSFSYVERLQFQKFLASPYFNEDASLSLFLEAIQDNIETATDIDYALLWSKAMPDRDLDMPSLRLKLSRLLKLAESFLVIHPLKIKGLEYELRLADILSQRKLIKHYNAAERRIKKQLSEIEKSKVSNPKFTLQYELLKHKHIQQIDSRAGNNNLTAVHQSLDAFYILEKLKYYYEALNLGRIRNVDIDTGMSEIIIEEVKKSGYLEIPAVRIYYQAYLLLTQSDVKTHFNALQEVLKEEYLDLLFEEALSFYTLLQNICVQEINRGDSEYLKKLLELYKDVTNIKLFSKQDNMSPWFFKNAVTAGLLTGEYIWVENFIKEYSVLLPKEEIKNAYTFNMANLHYYKKEYEQTISILSEVKFGDVAYALGGRWLLIRAYYELDEWYSLDSLLSSFRLYLMRNKLITSPKKKQYLNLIRYVQKLMRIAPNDKAKIIKLKDKLTSEENVPTKKWLLDKLEQMLE